MSSSRRAFIKSLSRAALVLPLQDVLKLARSPFAFNALEESSKPSIGATFVDVAREAGLNAKTVYGGEHKNKYLLVNW